MAIESAKIIDEWATEDDFAAANNLTKRSVARLRAKKNGLPFRRFGKRVMIHVPTAREWLLKGLIRPNPERPISRVPSPKAGGREDARS